MKARLLKKLLDNTEYTISNERDYIAVGSPLCHDLISVNKETLTVRYALDTFNEGKKAIRNEKLVFIWDKLHEFIASGEIHDVINGKDEIENPLPVFRVTHGKLVESVTDAYGWPNTDDDGICMYENTHFPTRKEALLAGIQEAEAGEKMMLRRVKELEEDLEKAKNLLKKEREEISYLNSLLKQKPVKKEMLKHAPKP